MEDWNLKVIEDVQMMNGVNKLLSNGSLASNKNIHELDFGDIFENIFGTKITKDQKS